MCVWCVCVCVFVCLCVCHCVTVCVTVSLYYPWPPLQDGTPQGKGLVTFPDGTHGLPRNEGCFKGGKCVERFKVSAVVTQAQKDAAMARSIAEQAGN